MNVVKMKLKINETLCSTSEKIVWLNLTLCYIPNLLMRPICNMRTSWVLFLVPLPTKVALKITRKRPPTANLKHLC